MSPISSRKTVPPSATSSLPRFWVDAPVKAPFSWPNSSDSRSSSDRATQFTGMNKIGRAHVELQSRGHLVCRLLLEKKKKKKKNIILKHNNIINTKYTK